MESKNATPVIITYGIIAGLAMIVYSIILYMLDLSMNRAMAFISYAILAVVMVLGVKKIRDDLFGGYINFGKAFASGLMIALVAAILNAIYTYVFVSFIDTGYIDKILVEAETSMLERGTPDEQIDVAMEWTRKFMTPGWMASWVIIGTLFYGGILSLIISLIMKKKPSQPV